MSLHLLSPSSLFFVIVAGHWEDLPSCHEVRHRRGAHLFPQRGHPKLHDPQDGPVGPGFSGDLHSGLSQRDTGPNQWMPSGEASPGSMSVGPVHRASRFCSLGSIPGGTKPKVSTFSIFINLFILFYSLEARIMGRSVLPERKLVYL